MKSARIALAFLPALLFIGSVQAQVQFTTPPIVIHKVDPEYSEQARRSKCQGVVVLNVVVQRDGTVRNMRVAQSLDRGLDEKAIEAVRQWRFRPGMKNAEPVDVASIIEVTFRLMRESWWSGKTSAEEEPGNCDPQPVAQAPATPLVDPVIPNVSNLKLIPPTLTRNTNNVPGPQQIFADIYLESLALLLTKIPEDQQAIFWNSLNQQTLKALREEEDEKRREAILQAHRDLENSLRQYQTKLK